MKTCQNCKYHATVTGPDRALQTQCRKELPKMITQFIPQGGGQVGILAQKAPWPVMEQDDWCGSHELQLN